MYTYTYITYVQYMYTYIYTYYICIMCVYIVILYIRERERGSQIIHTRTTRRAIGAGGLWWINLPGSIWSMTQSA